MRQLRTLILAATLGACATAPQTYHPYGHTGPAWPISGDFNFITHDLRVFVNGEPAAVGNLYSGTPLLVTGSYQGHAVRAECADYFAPPGGILMVLCDVFVDGIHAAFLTFD